MSDCKAYLREIEDASEDVAPKGAARAHVEVCRACGERLRERQLLRELVRGLGKVEAPADFDFRLRARMAAANGSRPRGPFGGLRPALRFAPVAAAACFLFVSASLYIWQSSRAVQTPPPRAISNEVTRGGAGGAQGQGAPAPALVQVSKLPETGGKRGAADVPFELNRRDGRVRRAATRRVKPTAQKAPEGSAAPAYGSTVADVRSAEVIRSRMLTIPLETASAPLRLVLRDEHGAERVVPVRAVSFGAQDLIGRDGVRRQTVSASDGGVW